MGLFTPMKIGFEKGKAVMVPMKKRKTNCLDHLAICMDSPKPEIHYHITNNNRFDYDTSGMTPREINEKDNEIRREILNNRNCNNCGIRFETNQKICEGCGVDLSRM